MQIRIYYEDTDIGGVVYYANYLKFCERARSDIFFQKGLSPHQENEFFVVKSLSANYITSATFGDLLDVQTNIIEIKNVSLKLNQKIFREGVLLFELDILLAYLKNSKPSKIPQKIVELFVQNQNLS